MVRIDDGPGAAGWALTGVGRAALPLLVSQLALAAALGAAIGAQGDLSTALVSPAVAALCLLGFWVFRPARARRVTLAGALLATVSGLMRGAELLLPGPMSGPATAAHPPFAVRAAAGVDVLGSVTLFPALIVAAATGAILICRAVKPAMDVAWIAGPTVVPPATVHEADRNPYPAPGLRAPDLATDLGRPPAELGICASGGGIRAAAVTLGALQVLRTRGVLARARYLVSVSGGGFTAGAFQLAQQPVPGQPIGDDGSPGWARTAPAAVFAEGSVEEDHVRRHGKYVADSGGEWICALGVVLRGAGASLALLAGVVTILGVLLGGFYRWAPLARFDYGYPFSPGAGGYCPPLPPVPAGVWTAALLAGLTGLLAWFLMIARMSFASRASVRLRLAAFAALGVAAGVLLLGVVVPAIVWSGIRAVWWVNGISSVSAGGLATGAATGTVTLAYLGSLSSMVLRNRGRLVGVGHWFGAKGPLRRLPGGFGQKVRVWSVLGGIGALYTVLFGAVVREAAQPGVLDAAPADWHWWPQGYLIVAIGGFVLVTALIDETWMSLHWFYRRRVATAFAVRRVRTGPGDTWAALPYDFEHESTPLSSYGARCSDFPQVIFAGAAALSGSDRTPPGRRAVSFSFSGDWVGGPQVGYVRTADLQRNLRSNLAMDLTVQSAVAVSGAAFASSMGVQARAYQTLLALSNARLGTWLPNPAWLYRRARGPRDWTQARLPRIRRIGYLLREVLGVYSLHDRLLLVTDGGHYDVLGLVELLRHRTRTVICIDSSGDAPPMAQALARAIGLATEELDIRVELDRPLDLIPGSAPPLDPGPPLASVNARLSAAAIVTGRITYPVAFVTEQEQEDADARGVPAVPDAAGRLIVVKLALTAAMPYELLAFAAANPAFPFDSTNDQWFDEGQFNSYQTLGRHLGGLAADACAMPAVGPAPSSKVSPSAVPSAVPAIPAPSSPGDDAPVRTRTGTS